MSSFTSPLRGEILDNGNIKLISSFEYYLVSNPNYIVRVPAGYESDFASVPQIFQWAVPKIGRHSKPAVLHDYLCCMWKRGLNTRKFADKVFLEAMTVKEVNFFTKYLAYFAVRSYSIFFCNKFMLKVFK